MRPRPSWRCAAVLALATVLAGCALQGPVAVRPLPSATATGTSDTAPDADTAHGGAELVVTIGQQPVRLQPYAASTWRGYGGADPYRGTALARQAAQRIGERHGLRQQAAWPIALLGVHCVVYQLPAGADLDRTLAALRQDPDVESAQPMGLFEVRAQPYNDPYLGLQSNLVSLDVLKAHAHSLGQGVRIAVVDTGVDIRHPDLAGRVPAVSDHVADGRPTDEAHGTAVAGLIGALPGNAIGIAGIAPQARIRPYRACWSARGAPGLCNTFTLAQALTAAIEDGTDIVNLSLGGPADALLGRLLAQGQGRGILFVGAVPPSGRREGFPTGIDGVLAVDRARRGPRWPGVLYAPGSEVFSLAPAGRYDAFSGSSMAAAQVSAVAALLLASQRGLGSDELAAVLARSAASQADEAGPVNACAALAALGAGQPGPCRGGTLAAGVPRP